MTKPTYTVAEMAAGLRAIHKYQDDFYYKSSMQEDELALLLSDRERAETMLYEVDRHFPEPPPPRSKRGSV